MQHSRILHNSFRQQSAAWRCGCAIFAVGFLLGGITVRGADCLTSPSGLVSWWPGENNANDNVGTNNGTLAGGVTFATGYVGTAFNFDGNNGSVIVADSSSLRLTNELTLEAWVNVRALQQSQAVIGKIGGAGGNNGYQLTLQNDAMAAYFNSPGGGWPQFTVASPSLIVTGVWSHVAFTYGQSAMKLYFNGIPVATNIVGLQPISTSTSRLRISGDENNHVYFDGLIDEPSVYNRALSDSEILAIYEAGQAGKCGRPVVLSQPASQVGYWGMSATFNVQARGTPPLAYTWLKNGAPIANATNSSLSLTNLQAGDAATYSVGISNGYGGVLSQPANLIVNPSGISLALYAGVTIQGVVGLTYGIQYNTDLSNTNNWHGIANVTLGAPTQLWFDIQSANQQQRYYRVVPGPISIP